MTETGKKLIELLRSVVICDEGAKTLISKDEADKLILLAKAHQVEHIAAHALSNLGDSRFENLFYASISNTTRQNYDLMRISKGLSENNIPFIVLKGPVVRKLYPSAWMRNSCDIDILVKEENLSEAGEVLESLSYKREEGLSAHDVSYKTESVHVELHFTLIEEYRFAEISNILSAVWENCTTENGVEFIMSDEYYYFYHIAHMVKHFESGGCGIRPILDLWILNHKTDFDKERRDALLSRGGILKFEKELVRLSEYWFSLSEEAGLTTLENFIFSGGAYGEIKNSVAIKKSMRGGKFKYLMHRLFAPYSQLVKYYPRLAKYPILLPYYEVKRWIQAMRRDGKTYRREFSENMKNDKSEGEVDKMLDTLGIR